MEAKMAGSREEPNWGSQLVWISIFASGHLYLARCCFSLFLLRKMQVIHVNKIRTPAAEGACASSLILTWSIQSIIWSLSWLFSFAKSQFSPPPNLHPNSSPVYPCGFVSLTPLELISIRSDKMTAAQIYISQRSPLLEAPSWENIYVHPDKTPELCIQIKLIKECNVTYQRFCSVQNDNRAPLFVFHLRWVILNY